MADIKLSGRRIEVSIIMNKMTICPTAMVTTLERKGDIWHKIITSCIRRWDQDRSTVEACNSDTEVTDVVLIFKSLGENLFSGYSTSQTQYTARGLEYRLYIIFVLN